MAAFMEIKNPAEVLVTASINHVSLLELAEGNAGVRKGAARSSQVKSSRRATKLGKGFGNKLRESLTFS